MLQSNPFYGRRICKSYVALTGLALRMIPFYVGFHPTLIYFAPSGLFAEHEVIQRAGTPAHPDGVKYTEL